MSPKLSNYLFLSYSTKDREFVDILREDLTANNINVWIDKEGLSVGTTNWEQAIRDAIRDAYAVILVATPNSFESRYVQGELEIAQMYSRKVFPVWAYGDDDKWAEYVPLHLIKTQYIDMRGSLYSRAIQRIVSVIKDSQVVEVTPHVFKSQKSVTEPRNPFKGLRAFMESDTRDFFGRDQFVQELINDLQQGQKFLALVGASGSGKSSIVMAGLIPSLKSGILPGSDHWNYLDVILPGSDPIESLALSLYRPLGMRINAVVEELNDSARSLLRLLRNIDNSRTKTVMIIDQFEELWTQTREEVKRSHFIDLIVNVLNHSPTIIILTLRGDFYDRPMSYITFGKLVEQATKSILPMDLVDIRRIIEGPVALPDVSVRFEEDLIGDLLFEVRGESGALPLLQFTLDQMFRKREGTLLTKKAYKEIGGVRGALAEHAELTYGTLPTADHHKYARILFLRLIEPGFSDQEITRRRADLNELILVDNHSSKILQEVRDIFIDARLLIASHTTIEVSHEALIREWKRLMGWITTAREDIQFQQMISKDTKEWIRKDRRGAELYRQAKLIDAQNWAQRNVISKEESEFIEASAHSESRALQLQLEKEKELNQLKSRFISMVSHEFRTPIATIASSADLLLHYSDRMSEDRKKEHLERIRNTVSQMVGMLDDVLTIGRQQAMGMSFNPTTVNVDSTLRNLLDRYKQLGPNHTFRYSNANDAVSIQVDERLFQLILDNLISNAVKYSPNGSEIHIKVFENVSELVIQIEDEGVGIPQQDKARLFEPFHRAANVGSISGTGLGLAIVKQAMDQHGGTIAVQSEVDKGTIFTIAFPKQMTEISSGSA